MFIPQIDELLWFKAVDFVHVTNSKAAACWLKLTGGKITNACRSLFSFYIIAHDVCIYNIYMYIYGINIYYKYIFHSIYMCIYIYDSTWYIYIYILHSICNLKKTLDIKSSSVLPVVSFNLSLIIFTLSRMKVQNRTHPKNSGNLLKRMSCSITCHLLAYHWERISHHNRRWVVTLKNPKVHSKGTIALLSAFLGYKESEIHVSYE